ncbi:MAG: ABC transporter ATP-binding protein [Anaerolineae bacterium]
MNPIIDVKKLEVSFKTEDGLLHAVRGVDFYVQPGEALGIVGESGSGKSATAKALVKLLPRDHSEVKGEIWYAGENLILKSERELQRIRGREIGMIFQDPMTSLNPTMRIADQIAEGYLRHHPGCSKKEGFLYAVQMLELACLPQAEERANDYPHTLSGGGRQRVMIALALASNPKLLIADEPTTALDVTIQAQILDILKEIQKKRQMSIVLITHDLSIVASFCDRILVMYAGKIVESASVDEFFSNPKHPYTKRLLQAIPRIDADRETPLLSIEGCPPDFLTPPPGCSFCPRCSEAMKICEKKEPPSLLVGKDHTSSCWLHHKEKP